MFIRMNREINIEFPIDFDKKLKESSTETQTKFQMTSQINVK